MRKCWRVFVKDILGGQEFIEEILYQIYSSICGLPETLDMLIFSIPIA
jgi:hypothetical protein